MLTNPGLKALAFWADLEIYMGSSAQDGENEQYLSLFLFFWALLWPNGLIFWSFVNCSEEILSVTVWKYFCFGPGNFFGFLKILCFCPKIEFFGNLWCSCATKPSELDWIELSRLPERLERFQKKGKSSEFNPQDYEKVQSSPALTVWSHIFNT